MKQKIYIAPETEVVKLNSKGDLMIEADPTVSTDQQLGNTGTFDDEGGDPFFDN